MEIVTVFACAECGFDNSKLSNEELTASIGAQARKYRAPLTRALPNEDLDALVRRRPAPEVWSALEYAVHQREVLGFYGGRIERVLAEDRPRLHGGEWHVAGANVRAPHEVVEEIAAAATAIGGMLESLSAEQWHRVGIGSSDGGERDIRNLASRLAHEGVHHLLDIGRSLRAARS